MCGTIEAPLGGSTAHPPLCRRCDHTIEATCALGSGAEKDPVLVSELLIDPKAGGLLPSMLTLELEEAGSHPLTTSSNSDNSTECDWGFSPKENAQEETGPLSEAPVAGGGGATSSLILKLDYSGVISAWEQSMGAEGAHSDSGDSGTSKEKYFPHGPLVSDISWDGLAAGGQRKASVQRYIEKRKRTGASSTNKIRYQSRKINAEQRPRVNGRFVKKQRSANYATGRGGVAPALDFDSVVGGGGCPPLSSQASFSFEDSMDSMDSFIPIDLI